MNVFPSDKKHAQYFFQQSLYFNRTGPLKNLKLFKFYRCLQYTNSIPHRHVYKFRIVLKIAFHMKKGS